MPGARGRSPLIREVRAALRRTARQLRATMPPLPRRRAVGEPPAPPSETAKDAAALEARAKAVRMGDVAKTVGNNWTE